MNANETTASGFEDAVFFLYDLRYDAAWRRARRERRAWGAERTEIHTLDNDHLVIEFWPGAAQEVLT